MSELTVDQKYLMQKEGVKMILKKDVNPNDHQSQQEIINKMLENVEAEIRRVRKGGTDFSKSDVIEYLSELRVEKIKQKRYLEELNIEDTIDANADYSDPLHEAKLILESIELNIDAVERLLD